MIRPATSEPRAYEGLRLPHWVAGSAVDRSARVMVDPRSGAIVPIASTDEVETFLSRISPALPRWLALTEVDRSDAVRAMAAAIEARRAELTDAMRFEFGLDEEQAAGLVRRSWRAAAAIAGEADTSHGTVAPGICAFVLSRHRRGKLLPALIARVLLSESIVVLKPSLATPLTNHLLAETICEAVPEGVVNLIHGDDETVDALVSSPLVGSIFVDGSPAAEEHVSRLGDLFHKPVVRYAEDARFSGSVEPAGPTSGDREDSDRKE